MQIGSDAPAAQVARFELRVRGVVQGVGFRPYVYQLARRHGLAGFVLNGARGVVIEIEGEPAAIEAFLTALPAEAPPLVKIAGIVRSERPVEAATEFVIRASEAAESAFTLIPTDICVCEACLADTRDPANRRFEYPFTNCTNCGPRYSIILDVPYDRKLTTMAAFAMCAACRQEYEDPGNRRFHAQPNACPVCGPELALTQRSPATGNTREVLEQVAELLRAGGIVALKGLGGYQLLCDARQPAAVEELRRRKRRNEKPFAIMVAGIAAAERIGFVDAMERNTLLSRERPIVLLRRRPGAEIAEAVSPRNPAIGVMLPYTPLHDLLFRVVEQCWGGDAALVMTSGNVSEEPIAVENEEAEQRLAGIADAFVHHNRRIHTRVDDSVVRVAEGEAMLVRRARGYAPQPVWLGLGEMEVLACGAQQKNTLCLTKAGFALPSQHLGDLENYETLEFFEQTLERMCRLFHVKPTLVAHDLHPGYLSTRYAQRLEGVRRIEVQHHHAHIASCMAEHGLSGPVIGVAWDGTGLGTDGTIWGGEFLVASLVAFERHAHLRKILLPGGDAAVREPWRLARSYLLDGFDAAIPAGLESSQFAPEAQVRMVDTMLLRQINTIPTSSCGRLFDAVASLLGLRHTVSFEGQAAMELEALADTAPEAPLPAYAFELTGSQPMEIDVRPMIRQIVEEIVEALEPAASQARIAARFHATLIAIVDEVCGRLRAALGLKQVCLSGGCFQNLRLLRGCVAALRAQGFEVFVQQQVPANDGGISLGQAAIACALSRRGA
jgi:hydrogenase maturation protein HypF